MCDGHRTGIGERAWQGLFIDFYGTIASGDVEAVEAVCQQVIDDHGLTVAASKLAVQWGHRFFTAIETASGEHFKTLKQIEAETLIQTILPLTGPVRVEKYIRSFNDYLARPSLFEEVPAVLDRLDLPVCIVSNADDEELLQAVEHHRLRVDCIVTSEQARSYKPDAGIFKLALAKTGWAPERVLHVGDSLHSDVGGAHRVGLEAAWINRAVRISDIGTERPDYTWPDLWGLAELTCGT